MRTASSKPSNAPAYAQPRQTAHGGHKISSLRNTARTESGAAPRSNSCLTLPITAPITAVSDGEISRLRAPPLTDAAKPRKSNALPIADGNRAAIMRVVGHLNAGNGPQLQIAQQTLPRHGRPEFQLNAQGVGIDHLAADRARTQVIAGFEQRVKASHAAKTAGESNVRQYSSEVSRNSRFASNNRCVLHKLNGRDAKLSFGDAAQMPLTTPSEAARSPTLSLESACSSMPARAALTNRLTASTGANPGARSGRHRKQGLNPSPSAAAAWA